MATVATGYNASSGGGAGLTAPQEAQLAGLGVDGYPLLTTISTSNVTAGLPHGWELLAPFQSSGLTAATAVKDASGKICTLTTDHASTYRGGQTVGGGSGWSRVHACAAFTAEIVISGIAYAELASNKYAQLFVGESYGGGVDAAWAGCRFFFQQAASPEFYALKSHKYARVSSHANSNATTITGSDASPPTSVSLRYVASRTGFQVYVNTGSWVEVGGGSVASGAFDWMRSSHTAINDTTDPRQGSPRRFIVELSTDETFGDPADGPALDVDSLGFTGVS